MAPISNRIGLSLTQPGLQCLSPKARLCCEFAHLVLEPAINKNTSTYHPESLKLVGLVELLIDSNRTERARYAIACLICNVSVTAWKLMVMTAYLCHASVQGKVKNAFHSIDS